MFIAILFAVNRIHDFNEVMFGFKFNKEGEIGEARLFTSSLCQDQVYTLCAKVMKARIVAHSVA